MSASTRDEPCTLEEINAAIEFGDKFKKISGKYPNKEACKQELKNIIAGFSTPEAKVHFVLTSNKIRHINQKDKFEILEAWLASDLYGLDDIAKKYWQKEVKQVAQQTAPVAAVVKRKKWRKKKPEFSGCAEVHFRAFNNRNTVSEVVNWFSGKAKNFKLTGKENHQKVMEMLKVIVTNNYDRPLNYSPSLFGEVYFELLKKCNDEDYSQYCRLYHNYVSKDLAYLRKFEVNDQSLIAFSDALRANIAEIMPNVSRAEMTKYTEYLWRTLRAIENRGDHENVERMSAIIAEYISTPCSKVSVIGGCMLAIFGVILAYSAYTLLAVSAGTSAPVSLLGITLGKSLITAGLGYAGMTTGAAMIVGGCVLGWSGSGKKPVSTTTNAATARMCLFNNAVVDRYKNAGHSVTAAMPKRS